MKQILLLAFFVLAFCLQGFGQENVNCPAIKLNSPSEQTQLNGNMEFSVSLMGKFENRSLGFKWTVSNGVSFSGQGTSAISIPIDENLAGQTLTATVEIKGLLAECKDTFSASGEIVQIVVCYRNIKQDEISVNSSWNEIFSRLKQLSLALQQEPQSRGLVVFTFANNSEFKKANSNRKKISQSLKGLKITKEGLIVQIRKDSESRIEFYFVPAGVGLPY